MSPPDLSGLGQVGAVGIILAALLALFLRLFQRLVERLMKHLDDTVVVLRELRDEVRGARAEYELGREMAVARLTEEIHDEGSRIVEQLIERRS